jgi:hypothetical protein
MFDLQTYKSICSFLEQKTMNELESMISETPYLDDIHINGFILLVRQERLRRKIEFADFPWWRKVFARWSEKY